MRRLVANADDLGLSGGVNRGIFEAFEAGSVTSASLMVNTPGWEDAAARARAAGGALGVGVHVNLVLGRPIEPVRSLVDPRTGEFLRLPALFARVLAGRVDPVEVAAECAAQIRRARSAGIEPTHLDSHRHTHAMPGLCRPILETAKREGVLVVRAPEERLGGDDALRPGAGLKKLAIASAWRIASIRAPRFLRADHYAGLSLQGGGAGLAARLVALLDALRPGTTELMVHPGRVDPTLEALETYTWQRERELDALLSPGVRERLGRGDIRLVHFGAL